MTPARLPRPALAIALLTLTTAAAGCFRPVPRPAPAPVPPDRVEDETTDGNADGTASPALRAAVAAALEDRPPKDARLYAAFYAHLSDRTAAGRDETAAGLAAVTGRASELLGLPGVLGEAAGRELDPVLNPPGPLDEGTRTEAAAAFARLADACSRVAEAEGGR